MALLSPAHDESVGIIVIKLLFVCTHNRCRSILSEAITRSIAGSIFSVKSAGSEPAGVVYPGTLQYLRDNAIDTSDLVSESWDQHEEFAPDIVITVCDSAANEACPYWMGKSERVHWSLTDPSKLPQDEQTQAFEAVSALLKSRLMAVLDEYQEDMNIKAVAELFRSVALT